MFTSARIKRLLLLLLAAAIPGPAPTMHAETPRLIVAIVVDQLRYDYLERYQDQFAPGGFNRLMKHGVFLTFARYDYCPTVTGPGHASIFGGSPPVMHGIIANDWIDKKTRKEVYCCGDPSVKGVGTTNGNAMSPRNFIGGNFADQLRLQYRSKVISVSLKDRGAILPAGKKPAGAYWFETRSGNFISSTYYVKDLPPWVNEFNARHRPASFAGQTWNRLLNARFYPDPDAAAGEGRLTGETNSIFPHVIHFVEKEGFDALMPTPYGNQVLAEFAEAAVEGEHLGQGSQPDLLCVSFSGVDLCGHRFGPYSQEIQDVVLRLDRQLAGLFQYLDRKIGLSHIEMVLTADHGVMPNPEYAVSQGLDGQRWDDSKFMVDLLGRLDKKFGPGKYFLLPKIYGGNVYFNPDTLRDKLIEPEELATFIRESALATGKIQACYSRGQLLEGRAPGLIGRLVLNGYNAERGGDMVIVPKPYIVPSGGTSGTTHGSPYTQDTHVPVLFFGAEFKPGRYADEFSITDIAPTLCASLHMDEPSGCTGRPFVKILRHP